MTTHENAAAVRAEVEQFRSHITVLRDEIAKTIVGNRDVVDGVITCMLAGGHALLEGVPGLGKTMLVRTLSETLNLSFSRVQFTPDLMPADILGTTVIDETQQGHKAFEFRKGPVFANILLADEINRATPKTQSALLEAMQEHRVSVGKKTFVLEEPFVVLATQNPLEMEGTYPLPEAQLDRFFFKLVVAAPSRQELHAVEKLLSFLINQVVQFQSCSRFSCQHLRCLRVRRNIGRRLSNNQIAESRSLERNDLFAIGVKFDFDPVT
jgi:MoxR-like ATPase